MIYSFDVFDTLITRKTATPKGVFAYMQRRLQKDYPQIDSYIRDNLFELRIGAEQAAGVYFANSRMEEITLEQIYEAMKRTSCLTNEDISLLMELEQETEIELALGVEKNIRFLKELYEGGKKIILISDMYLDAKTIRRMLVKVDDVFENIPLYVSSKVLKTKYTGSLFDYVKEQEAIEIENWIHVGDNIHSDILVPQRLGITVKAVNRKELLSFEKAALKEKEGDVYFQFCIGASANARFMYEENQGIEYQYGTSLGGNIAYPYLCWLLRRSLDLGIKRLYFIARDGYLLKEIADYIIDENRYDISTSYIYGSRKAWRMASLSKEHFDLVSLVRWTGYKALCEIEKLADFFELKLSELKEFLPKQYRDRAGLIEAQELDQIILSLTENRDFQKRLLEKQEANRKLLTKYLQQQVDCKDGDFAFVELIGSGYTQRLLSNVMEDFCEFPIQTFFYHMDAKLDTDHCIFYCYFPMKMEDAGMMELFYTAPHGHTIGYEETKDGIVVPLLDDENKKLIAYGLEDYIKGIKAFLTEFEKNATYLQEKEREGLSLSLFYRRYLASQADEQLVTYIGEMPYKYSGREKKAYKYAPILSSEEIRVLSTIEGYKKLPKLYEGVNFALSKKRSNQKEWEYWQKLRGFPIHKLEKKIVLYGAGKYGKVLYEAIEEKEDKEVVQWVDKNYDVLCKENRNLSPIEAIGEKEYDQIVIAILNPVIANEVKQDLINCGIKEEKIVTYERAVKERYCKK